jgi:hypothetical protein
MGLFGEKPVAHARRQDVLVGHVLNYAMCQFMMKVFVQNYVAENRTANLDNLLTWISKKGQLDLTDEQQQAQREDRDIAIAHHLMRVTRSNALKELREYGFYENTNRTFSDDEIKETIELAVKVRAILTKSFVTSTPMKLAGVNMPNDPIQYLSGLSKNEFRSS